MFAAAPFLVLCILPGLITVCLPMLIMVMRIILAPLSRFPSIHWRNLLTLGGLKMNLTVDEYYNMEREWKGLVVKNKEHLDTIGDKDSKIAELEGNIARLELDIQRKKAQLRASWARPVSSQVIPSVRSGRRNSVDTIYSTVTNNTNVYDSPDTIGLDVTDIFPPRTQMFAKTGYTRCREFKLDNYI